MRAAASPLPARGARKVGAMFGLMQDWPLTTDKLLDHAAKWHGGREVVARQADGTIGRKSYAEVHRNAKRLSNALLAAGVQQGDRIATLAMNGVEHLEVWYGIGGIGAVCHTLNPRLFEAQLIYIVNHAGDRLLFSDGAFAPILERILPECPTVERVVFLSAPPAEVDLPVAHDGIAAFIEGHGEQCAWGEFDERTAAGLCYTSGTTGNPKGVLYSHRSNFLHTMMTLQADMFGFTVRDVVLPVVPMYHANAWGITFSAPAVGATLAMPGAQLDGASLYDLMEQEGVTVAAGVPTVWLGLLQHLTEHGLRPRSLERVIIGGAACPERLIRGLAALDIEPAHAWGMTELSPLGVVGTLTPEVAALPFDAQMPWRIKQGRSPCGLDLKLVGEEGETLPHDGAATGALRVRGPAVASAYYGDDRHILDEGGYFDTGDIATIDEQGFMRITDRAKDIIKSGGEWISSQEIENVALLHPKAALAAVIGMPDEKWGERPLLFVQLRPGETATAREFLEFLTGRLARWWVPDEVIFVDPIPLGATGKVDKMRLRSSPPTGDAEP